eukprot:gene6708-6929_t
MRGHGSLQQLLGKRIIGKKQKPDEQPGKRQNQSKVAPAAAAGQQTKLFNFWGGSGTQAVPNAKEPDPERSNPSSLFNEDTKYSAELKPGLPSFTVYTKVVGGRYQSAEQPPLSKEQEVQLVREPSNPVDPNAILVCSCGASGTMRPHGHLPASVSAHLAGLLDAHLVEITAQQVSTLDGISSNEPHGASNTSSSMSASSAGAGNLGNGQLTSQLKLTVTLTASGQQAGVRDVASTIDIAASAGLESLEAGKHNGAVLAASFDHILQQTWVHDLHLLNADEQMVLQEIQRLPDQARALLLRLLLRKRRWFQLSGLSYADVPDPNAAAQQLARAGFVMWSHDELAPLDSLMQELPVAILKPVLAALLPRNHPAIASASAHSTQKEALISSIQASASRTRLQAAINASAGVWLTLLPAVTETFNRMQRLYFISPGQDLGMFVAVDRGVLRYPTYSIRRTSPVFPNRRALMEYEQALQLAAQVEEALEAGDNHAAWHLVQPALAALRAGAHNAIHLGTVAASLLEKQKRWGEASEVLRLLLGGNACVTRRGDWWTRLAINLEHQGQVEQALEAVEASLADSWVRGGDLLGLQRRLLRLGKPPRRWKRPSWSRQVEWEPPELAITGRPLNCTTGAKSRFYGLDGSQVSVEELALQHYATPEGGGWQGLHSEGGVWATLFGLLMWDVLFEGERVAPLDLDCDTFYPARRSSIDMQLSRIADGQAAEILSASWSAHCGVMCRGVNWARFSKQQLLDICACVGGLGLAAVLRLMAEDHSGAQGGLPDLLLWRMADHSVKMVEVKGPRDRLSHQQRFWLAHMANSTIQVEVCKVKEPQGLASRSSTRCKPAVHRSRYLAAKLNWFDDS